MAECGSHELMRISRLVQCADAIRALARASSCPTLARDDHPFSQTRPRSDQSHDDGQQVHCRLNRMENGHLTNPT